MRTSTILRKVFKPAVVAAAVGVALPLLTASPASADPKQFTALIAMGLNTTQAVMEAFVGESNGTVYLPLKSSAASGNRQIANWLAAGPNIPNPIDCITPKAPGATIVRPVGSTNGRRALSRALNNEKWGGPNCGTADAQGKNPSGLINIARSSSGPSTGTDLAYLPFARDAVGFAYYKQGGGTAITSFTKAQLTTIFTTVGPHVFSGTTVVGCGINTGSGTFKDWNTALGMSAANEDIGTDACNDAGTGIRVEEHDSDGLKAKGDALGGGVQVIVGMGAAPFIGQWNGVAVDRTDPAVNMGSITDDGNGNNLGQPYNGTFGSNSLSPDTVYYGNGVFGRNVYNVISNGILTGAPLANQDYKTLLVGSSSVICQTGTGSAQARANLFGFLTLASGCGTASTGAFITGNLPTA